MITYHIGAMSYNPKNKIWYKNGERNNLWMSVSSTSFELLIEGIK